MRHSLHFAGTGSVLEKLKVPLVPAYDALVPFPLGGNAVLVTAGVVGGVMSTLNPQVGAFADQ